LLAQQSGPYTVRQGYACARLGSVQPQKQPTGRTRTDVGGLKAR
jgi:hypothetical protein